VQLDRYGEDNGGPLALVDADHPHADSLLIPEHTSWTVTIWHFVFDFFGRIF
jgi:hypothetical protein